MAAERIIAKFVPATAPLDGAEFDTIDLTPAQGRKGAGIAWAELGEPISAEPGPWAAGDGQNSGFEDITAMPDAVETETALSDPTWEDEQSVEPSDPSQEIILQYNDLYATDDSELVDGTVLDDRIFAGDGNDTISGYAGQDEIWAGGGDDTIFGNAFELWEDGGAAKQNSAFGGAGNDILFHGGGFQAFDGGDGYDLIYLTEPSSDYVIRHYSGGGLYDQGFNYTIVFFQPNGIDIHVDLRNVEAITFGNGVTFELETGTGEVETRFVVMDDGTTENIPLGFIESSLVEGTSGDDALASDSADIVAYGKAGDDTLSSAGSGVFDGGEGYDTLELTQVSHASFWRDSLDKYHVSGGSSHFTVIGVEALRLADGTVLELSQEAVADSTDGHDELFASALITTLDGGGGDDILNDYHGADTLIGGDGNDTLNGRWGKNTLIGGDGNDSLISSDVGAVLHGGAGNDYLVTIGGEMTGGEGADVFHLMLHYGGTTIIHDFKVGEDRFEKYGAAAFSVTQKGTSAVIASEFKTVIIEHASAASVLELLTG